MKIVTSAQMREIERQSETRGISTDLLMENAGLLVAETCRRTIGVDEESQMSGRRVLVLVGPGDNGGDGIVAARHLSAWGAHTTVYLVTTGKGSHSKLSCLTSDVNVIRAVEDPNLSTLDLEISQASIIVDAVLGTGLSRPISGHLASQMARVSQAKLDRPELIVVAVDMPSGVNSDTAKVDSSTIAADVTVALGFPKTAHCALPGADFCGLVSIEDIGLPSGLDSDVDLSLITPDWASDCLPDRPTKAHKGTFGKVLIIAGSHKYVGAAYLASMAAARVGAGLVTVGLPTGIQMAVAARAPEITYLTLPETSSGGLASAGLNEVLTALPNYSALLVGCGLGSDPETSELVSNLLLTDGLNLPPTILDADALNILAAKEGWHRSISSQTVLTPHAGEMARLMGSELGIEGSERVDLGRNASKDWNTVIVFKGAYTVVAEPEGTAMISPFANPGMATAGTGDVLAGVIAGLLAQGLAPLNAAALGVFLHGSAGEAVRAELGEAGMIAGDLICELPQAIKSLLEV